MEMGNVSKRQQPDRRKNNSRRSLTGLQCSETFPHLQLAPKQIYTSSVIMNAILISKLYTRN